MEIMFKEGRLQPLNFSDEDYQKFDGILALILNRLNRLCIEREIVVVNYPTTIEEFATYAIAKQFCILTRKKLIVKDNRLIRLNPIIKDKRKVFLSKDCQPSIFLSASMRHNELDISFKPWDRAVMPLLKHDYTSIMLIALHYGYPIEKISEIEYKDLKRFYINQEVMHWDDL